MKCDDNVPFLEDYARSHVAFGLSDSRNIVEKLAFFSFVVPASKLFLTKGKLFKTDINGADNKLKKGVATRYMVDVLEECHGDLNDFIENGRVAVEKNHHDIEDHFRKCCVYFTQMMYGIGHLHHLGTIHRDITSGNGLFSRRPIAAGKPRVVVSDLGLCSGESVSRRHTGNVGTRGFQAPEVKATSTKNPKGIRYTKQADVWSSGATFVSMISLNELIDIYGQIPAEVLEKYIGTAPGSWEGTQLEWVKAWEGTINAMLHVDPGKRPSIKEVIESFLRLLKYFGITEEDLY